MYPEGAMLARVREADKAGLQTMIHAIGDRANDLILTIFEQVERENGDRDRRFRIEHAQHLRPQDIPRFSRDKVIVSMQPYHAIDDGRWAEKRIGKERAKTTYAFRSMLDSGATLAFGTDWTVAPLNPVLTVYAALHDEHSMARIRRVGSRSRRFQSKRQCVPTPLAQRMPSFRKQVKGSISVGKLA
jgi:predicted amidohydrolase YtcJ